MKNLNARMFLPIVLLALPGASACGGAPGTNCTLVGCDSGVTFVLPPETYAIPEPVSVRLCIDGWCSEKEYTSGSQIPPMVRRAGAQEEETKASAEVRTSDRLFARLREKNLKLGKSQPNGPRCGPTCYQGGVEVPLTKT